jgi:hypothetical protein
LVAVVDQSLDTRTQAYELPGAYHFHGHGGHLTLTSEACASQEGLQEQQLQTTASSGQARVVSLHSAHGVHLFRFTGGASIHARGIGFQVSVNGGIVCLVVIIRD